MVEPQDIGELKEGLGAPLLHVLQARVGQPTLVRMADGTIHTVFDGSGWGRDLGDAWEHLTAILGPDHQAESEFFYMSDVECLIDPDTRVVLISQTPAPGET
jgi:hypothetical protein